MYIKIESRMFDIKGFGKTIPDTVPIRIQISVESVGESVVYIHKPDKSLILKEKSPESVVITAKCTYYVPYYIKDILYSIASGLGKTICITDTIIHKCTIPELTLSKELLLNTLDTIIEIIEKKQPEIK